MKTSKLPTIQELVKNIDVYEKKDKLNFLLNQPPPSKWVKEHPYIRGHKYLPIDKVEYLLRSVFKNYKIEILREGVSFNGIFVTVRLHYVDLVTGEWNYHDGIGAIHLQTKKGSSPADLNNINNGALSMAYPLAKTLAIKDACDMFGKLFGSDLNRRDTLPAKLTAISANDKLEEIKILFEKSDNMSEENQLNISRIIDNKEVMSYDKAINHLKQTT